MERDDRNYHREFERKLHNDNRQFSNRNNNDRDYDRHQNQNRSFENYRDRYDNQRGNYYGLSDDNYEYRNVRSTGSTNYGSGPVTNSGSTNYGRSNSNSGSNSNKDQDHYRYGDRNPYMNDRRNSGYDTSKDNNWERHDSYRTTGDNRSTNYSAGRDYSRQDNSYQYGGEGRRYGDFNRDEHKKMNDNMDSGFNMLGIDAYTDRGENPTYTDNNYRGTKNNDRFYEGHYNNSESWNRGDIRSTGNSSSDDNYATGLYSSNRSYNSDHSNNNDSDYDYSQRSSRYRKPGERSGPNYGASSGASDYGHDDTRG